MNIFNILFYGFLAGTATVLGAFSVLIKEEWARRKSIYFLSFATGVLLSFSFSHLLPEASKLSSSAFLVVLLTILVFYALEHSLVLHYCRESEVCDVHKVRGFVSFLGIILHSLIDGLAIGVGFEVSLTLGILSTVAVIFHEVPEGILTMVVSLAAGFKKEKALAYSFLVAGATPLGAILSLFLMRQADFLVGIFLAIAAGSFLYVAASDLIPEIHQQGKRVNIFLTFLGASLPFLLTWFL